jgi:putative ABC transport system permease protein
MMVLGIGGCTALLVTGFGIKDSIHSVVDDQYDKISLYDYAVTFQDPQTTESAEDYLIEKGWDADMALLVHSGSIDAVTDSGTKSVYLVASATDSLDGFTSLQADGETIPYPGVGEAVVTDGLAKALNIQAGQTLQLRDENLGTMTVTVTAVCENYVYNYVYISPQTYRELLGEDPEYKTLYLLAHEGADPYAESVDLSDDSVASITVNESLRDRVNSLLERLNYVVAIVVVCAGALAFIVLYNLTNINITERIREIATT